MRDEVYELISLTISSTISSTYHLISSHCQVGKMEESSFDENEEDLYLSKMRIGSSPSHNQQPSHSQDKISSSSSSSSSSNKSSPYNKMKEIKQLSKKGKER